MQSYPSIKTAGGCPAASYLLLRRQKKVTEEKATPVCRRYAVLCVAQPVRPPHKLARSATRPRAQTYSSDCPWPACATRRRTGEM